MNGVYMLSAVVFILIFLVNPLAEYYKEKNVSGMVRKLKDRFFLAVFYGFGSIVLMVCLCWQLSVVILFLAFFEIFCMSKASVRIRKLSKEIQEGKAGGNHIYFTVLKCLKCIRMLSLHDIMYEKFSRINTEIAELQIKRGVHITGMNAVSDFFSAVNLLGTLFAGIVLYFGGYTDLGSVMAFLVVQDGITYMFSNLKDFLLHCSSIS